MSILNWLKSIFGKKSNEVISYRQDINEDVTIGDSATPIRFNTAIVPEALALGYLVDLRYCSYNNRDEYDKGFGDIMSIQFHTEHYNGKFIDVTRVYYFDVDEHVYYYTGFEPQKVRHHRQYIENGRNPYPGNTRKPVSKSFDTVRSNNRNTSSSSDDDSVTHALLNPLSPTNIWNSSDDSSGSSHDSSPSSSYDSGCDSGGDCGGGD